MIWFLTKLLPVWGEEVKNVGPSEIICFFFFPIPATLESVYVHTHVCELPNWTERLVLVIKGREIRFLNLEIW